MRGVLLAGAVVGALLGQLREPALIASSTTSPFMSCLAGPVRGQPHSCSARNALVTAVAPAARAGRPRPRPPAQGHETGSTTASVAESELAQPPRPLGDTALLPPDGAVGAWKKADNPRVYSRADLYGYIDGGAELFFEFGFEELTQQKYGDGSSEIVLDFYRMTDAVAAHGVYLMKCGKETRHAAFGERHTINRYQLMFTRDRYFAILSQASGSEIQGPEMVKIASFVASKLPPHRPLNALTRLPRAGLVEDSVRLVRGPVALQAVFTLGDGDILQLRGRVTAVAGAYADPARGTWTQIAATYPTPSAASAAMTYLQGHLDPYLTVVSRTPGRLVFRDHENKFGVVSVTGSDLSVRLRLRDAPRQP